MLDKNISNFCISFTILDSSSRRKLVRYEIIFPLKNLDAYLFHNWNELKIDIKPQKRLKESTEEDFNNFPMLM